MPKKTCLPSPGRKSLHNADGRDIERCNCTVPRQYSQAGRPYSQNMSGQSLSPCRENLSPGNAYAKEHFRSSHRSPVRDPDGCSPVKTAPAALSENGRRKHPGDWNVYQNVDFELLKERLDYITSPINWKSGESASRRSPERDLDGSNPVKTAPAALSENWQRKHPNDRDVYEKVDFDLALERLDYLSSSIHWKGIKSGDAASRRSPERDSDGCSNAPAALKYPGDWDREVDYDLIKERLDFLTSPINWKDAKSGDAASQCRMWKGSVSEHVANQVDGVEERYLREVEALRSQLLQLDQLRSSVDGKRLRQRSESDTNGSCCAADYRHSSCVGKEPKRPRDYRCVSPFHGKQEGAVRHQQLRIEKWLKAEKKKQGSSAPSGSDQTEEVSSAVSCASSCGDETDPDRAFVRSSEADSITARTSTSQSCVSVQTASSADNSCKPGASIDNAPTESAESAAVKPKPKGKKYVEHPGPHTLDGLRSSLFSYVPPYVRFVMHDEKGQPLPPSIQRYLKWNLSNITPIVVRRTVANSGYRLVRKSNEWTGTWGKHMKSLHFKLMKDYQKLNHFPGTFQIGRKDRLWKNLYRLITKFGKKEFGFIPRTFVLPQDSKLLRSAWERSTAHEAWIVKPPASARGTGIKVIHRWGHIPKKRPLVVQKYIERPYLINGSKFDLRLYVLVTSIHPLRIYLYDDGLVRFASVKYSGDPASLADRYMHLTNYSINKLSSLYTANEDASACKGHKWTIKSLWKYLSRYDVDVDSLWKRLVDLSIKTIISGESSINQLGRAHLNSRYCCYELFGLDVLFDQDLKPWLLEVNISPSLHSTSPLDMAVKGPMVRDLMNMVGHHVPNKLAPCQQEELIRSYKRHDLQTLCFDKRLYTVTLSAEERSKHILHQQANCREEYLPTILEDLTADDVRHLIQFEDELTQCGRFQKVFPTAHTHEYHQFFESPRYYNMVFDAWETKYHRNREEGIRVLEELCKQKLHLQVPIPSGRVKGTSPSPPQPPLATHWTLLKNKLKRLSLSNTSSLKMKPIKCAKTRRSKTDDRKYDPYSAPVVPRSPRFRVKAKPPVGNSAPCLSTECGDSRFDAPKRKSLKEHKYEKETRS